MCHGHRNPKVGWERKGYLFQALKSHFQLQFNWKYLLFCCQVFGSPNLFCLCCVCVVGLGRLRISAKWGLDEMRGGKKRSLRKPRLGRDLYSNPHSPAKLWNL